MEQLSIFVRKTAQVNFFFTVLLSLLLKEATVSVTSIYLTAYALNRKNDEKHINVGLQCFQLICIILNWSTGNWVNTLLAGILSLEFVVYFVAAIIYLKSSQLAPGGLDEFILHNIIDKHWQGLFLSLLVVIEAVTVAYVDEFPQQPVVLAVSSYMLAYPDLVPIFATVLTFFIGFALHLYMSLLFV